MPTVATATIDKDTFIGIAQKYADNRAFIDVCVKMGKKPGFNAHERLTDALQVMGLLEDMADNGAPYTPDVSLGFGSDNASSIANSILGRNKSAAQVRSNFAKLGK